MAYRPKNLQERIVHRLKITQGHLRKVTEMVEEDAYCIDVLNQSLAVQKALKEIDQLMLENHLRQCVSHAHHHGDHTDPIAEVINVFKKSNA